MNKKTKALTEWALDQLGFVIEHLEKALENGNDGYDMLANEEILVAERKAEKAIIILRDLPFCSGIAEPEDRIRLNIIDAFPCKLGYTEKGWFCLKIPLLLPKKEGGNTWYIRGSVLPYFEDFFKKGIPHKYDDCVVVYRHIYDENRPEKQWRDHDNIETNMITDILGMYLMPDDGPLICDHYYCSSKGICDCTEVYLIPKREFSYFLDEINRGCFDSGNLIKEYPEF